MKEYRILELDLKPFLQKEGYLVFSPDYSELVLIPVQMGDIKSLPRKFENYLCVCYLTGIETEEQILKKVQYFYGY